MANEYAKSGQQLIEDLTSINDKIDSNQHQMNLHAEAVGNTFDAIRRELKKYDSDFALASQEQRASLVDLIKKTDAETRAEIVRTFLQLQSSIDASEVRHTNLISVIIERLKALETSTTPPKPPVDPPAPSPDLVVNKANGTFERRGQKIRDWSYNASGYALWSPIDKIRKHLDELRDAGTKTLRIHHYGRDVVEPEGEMRVDSYKPTRGEIILGLPYFDTWMDELANRDMLAAFSVVHRQRIDPKEAGNLKTPGLADWLFGERDSGIIRGEIQDSFYWFDEMLDHAVGYCELMGKRYANHPALGFVDPLNEMWCCRSRGYWPAPAANGGDRNRTNPPLNARGIAWFGQLDKYQAKTGLIDKQMTTPQMAKFMAANGRRVQKVLRGALRGAGVTCPIGTSAFYGATPYTAMVEAEVGDYVNIHRYVENETEPNPFASQTVPGSMEAGIYATSFAGKPTVITEWGSVYQNGPKRLTYAPSAVDDVAGFARACRAQGVAVANYYCGWAGSIGVSTDVYSGLGRPDLRAALLAQRGLFLQEVEDPAPTVDVIRLGEVDVYGSEKAGVIVRPARFGEQPWAVDAIKAGPRRASITIAPEAIPVDF